VHKYRASGCPATKYCTVVPNICGSSVRNLLHVTLLVPRILNLLLGYWKIYAPWHKQCTQNAELLNVTASGTYSYHLALEGEAISISPSLESTLCQRSCPRSNAGCSWSQSLTVQLQTRLRLHGGRGHLRFHLSLYGLVRARCIAEGRSQVYGTRASCREARVPDCSAWGFSWSSSVHPLLPHLCKSIVYMLHYHVVNRPFEIAA
jgi:hypothetical protein